MRGTPVIEAGPHGFNVTVVLPTPEATIPLQPVTLDPVPQRDTPRLAFTGADVVLLLAVALVLLALGGALLRRTRPLRGGHH